MFRRKSSSATGAAGVVWIAGKTNGLLDRYSGVRSADIMRYFGIKGSPSQRGEVMLRAGGFDNETMQVRLGSGDFLIASRREWIIGERDRLRARIESD